MLSMSKDIVTMKSDQLEIKNDILQIKNILEGIHKRLGEAKDKISELKEGQKKNHSSREPKRKTIKKTEENNIHIIGVPEGEESE